MSNPSRKFAHELHEYLRNQAHWKTIARWLLTGLAVLCLVVWFGRDFVEELELLETWIKGHGVMGSLEVF